MARCLDAIPEGSNALIGKEPRRIGARLVLEGVLQPDSGFDFLRVSVTLLTLHVPIAAQVVRQIRVVVKTVIKAVLLRGYVARLFFFLHGAKKEKNADSAVKSNETLWFCKKGCLTRSPKKRKSPENTSRGFKSVVPKTGLEPACLAALRPEHSASTNFATWAARLRSITRDY